MKTKNTIHLIFIFIILHCFSNAQINPGHIVFIGFNSDNPDNFSFILLENMPANTSINFTDKGWTSSGSFRSGEGILTWTSPSTATSVGTIINIYYTDSWMANSGNVSGGISLSSGADQILAFTGDESNSDFITAIQFNSNSGWNSDATTTDESALPDGLINDSTALALPALNNSIYVGPIEGTKTELLEQINNPDHWYGSDTYHFDLKSGSFPYNVLIESGDWETPSNWKSGYTPADTSSVIISENIDIQITASAVECKNIFIEARGTLEIYSGQNLIINNNLHLHSRTASYAAGIINKGTIAVSGTTIYERWIPSDDWHIISSPVSGQVLNNFVLDNSIQYFDEDEDYDLAPYDEPTDGWYPYTTASDNYSMVVGKGYAMRRSEEASSQGSVTFTGALNHSDVQIMLTRNNNGWNCIGNPFASAIQGTGNPGFLNANLDKLDPNFAGLYVWDHESNDYTVYVNSDAEAIASCQGFIVRAKNGGETVTIGTDLQTFSLPSFKSEEIPWPAIVLTVSGETVQNSTRFVFNDEMTIGLDPAYDAGKLKGNTTFSLYSKLINENDIDFAVQALPVPVHETYRIPIGFDCSKGGEVTFTATTLELPANMQVILEDVQNQKFYHLGESAEKYTTIVEENYTGTGRFYLLTNDNGITPSRILSTNDFEIYVNGKIIKIQSSQSLCSDIQLYNMNGNVCSTRVQAISGTSMIDATGYPQGIYILKFKLNGRLHSEKITLAQ